VEDGNEFSYVTGGFAYGKVDLDGTSKMGIASASVLRPPRLVLEIDIGKRLSAVIAHYKTSGLFFD